MQATRCGTSLRHKLFMPGRESEQLTLPTQLTPLDDEAGRPAKVGTGHTRVSSTCARANRPGSSTVSGAAATDATPHSKSCMQAAAARLPLCSMLRQGHACIAKGHLQDPLINWRQIAADCSIQCAGRKPCGGHPASVQQQVHADQMLPRLRRHWPHAYDAQTQAQHQALCAR